MCKFRIALRRIEPPIRLVDKDNTIESDLCKKYDPKEIAKYPKTEDELYRMYSKMGNLLLDYYNLVMGEPAFELSNEVRAILGHLVDYNKQTDGLKENLKRAHAHFRRLNLDAFKILCDEYDKVFSKLLVKFYRHDLRAVAADFLKTYYKQYFEARGQYLSAQNEESLGKNDSIVYDLYFEALKRYIVLKNTYLEKRKKLKRGRIRSIACQAGSIIVSAVCGIISLIGLFIQ